jgi:hypothetical protein
LARATSAEHEQLLAGNPPEDRVESVGRGLVLEARLLTAREARDLERAAGLDQRCEASARRECAGPELAISVDRLGLLLQRFQARDPCCDLTHDASSRGLRSPG